MGVPLLLNKDKDGNAMRINTIRLRTTIGWLGMMLPWIVVMLIGYFPQSISATWYTNACTVFMIILGSASFLLISYKGYEKIDDVLLTCSGIAGLGVCLFPCSISEAHEKVGTFLIDNHLSNIVHCICAFIFFALLAFNSIFLFTKSAGEKTKKKKARNIIFIICGIGMLLSFLMLLIPNIPHKVWVVETIALFFFGISFLTKANIYPWLFCDDKQERVKEKGEGT